jgi:hypothetical protein
MKTTHIFQSTSGVEFMSRQENHALAQFALEMKKLLGVQQLDVDAPMLQLGVDSLNIVEMVVICQQVYLGVTNNEDIDIDGSTTICELDAQLTRLLV